MTPPTLPITVTIDEKVMESLKDEMRASMKPLSDALIELCKPVVIILPDACEVLLRRYMRADGTVHTKVDRRAHEWDTWRPLTTFEVRDE